jgi:hypothetical protein
MRWILLAIVLIGAALFVVYVAPSTTKPAPPPVEAVALPPEPYPVISMPATGLPRGEVCNEAPAFVVAAVRNALEVDTLVFTPFGRPETGWRIYAPHVASEIATACEPEDPGFANALAGWQRAHRRPSTGVLDPETFQAMKVRWHLKRPFVVLSRATGCPPAATPTSLAATRKDEVYGATVIELRADALAAWRRMVADAREQDPAIAKDRQALLIFSGFRAPDADDLRCETEGNCDNVVRTPCSAHRTGLAFDIVVGSAPGGRVDSTDDANRLAMSRSPAYRWLVRNAHRYGFVNYVFEPWHWEWSPPEQPGASRA